MCYFPWEALVIGFLAPDGVITKERDSNARAKSACGHMQLHGTHDHVQHFDAYL